MTTLTLIYAADMAGNFTDPKTGECWNIPADREFFKKKVANKIIICGRKTFEEDGKFLTQPQIFTPNRPRRCIVLTRYWNSANSRESNAVLRKTHKSGGIAVSGAIHALNEALFGFNYAKGDEEIFCVGGKQTIEALAPFASRILATEIDKEELFLGEFPLWLPKQIEIEAGGSSGSYQGAWEGDYLYGAPEQWERGYWVRRDIHRHMPIEF